MKTASMTQQQKREKAAELLGWVKYHPTDGSDPYWHLHGAGPLHDSLALPRYDEDLNLMHQIEGVMDIDEKSDYADLLGRNDPIYGHDACMATAAQRLDAWLEVMLEGES